MDSKPDFEWYLTPNHWIEAFITDTGITYVGWDYDSQSGGGYSAGFQSFEQFLAEGRKGMPEEVASAMRERVAALPRGQALRIEIGGDAPEEVHADLDGQVVMVRGPVLFEGTLPLGDHRVSGIAMYPGTDARGRRVARTFEHVFTLPGPDVISVRDLKPRWPDADG